MGNFFLFGVSKYIVYKMKCLLKYNKKIKPDFHK